MTRRAHAARGHRRERRRSRGRRARGLRRAAAARPPAPRRRPRARHGRRPDRVRRRGGRPLRHGSRLGARRRDRRGPRRHVRPAQPRRPLCRHRARGRRRAGARRGGAVAPCRRPRGRDRCRRGVTAADRGRERVSGRHPRAQEDGADAVGVLDRPAGAWIGIAAAAIAAGGGAEAAVAAYDLSWLAAAIAARVLWRQLAAWPDARRATRAEVRAVLRYGAPRAPSALLAQALFWGDLFVLAHYASGRTLDAYAAAGRIAQLILLFLTSVNLVFSPFAADLHARGERRAARRALQARDPLGAGRDAAARDRPLRGRPPGARGVRPRIPGGRDAASDHAARPDRERRHGRRRLRARHGRIHRASTWPTTCWPRRSCSRSRSRSPRRSARPAPPPPRPRRSRPSTSCA